MSIGTTVSMSNNNFEIADSKGDATVFAAQTHMKMRKIRD